MWTYSQTKGRMEHNGVYMWTAYSGFGIGKNNPIYEQVHNIGPLPKGLWRFGAAINSSDLGPLAIPILPEPGTETYGRTDFYCHGEDAETPGCSSHGCVVKSPISAREMIANSGDNYLTVIE